MNRTVLWLKRDLRLDDHEPLLEAARAGETVALYVYEPIVYGAAEHDACHLGFINQCLTELREELRERGGELLVRHGPLPEVLDRLFEELPFDALRSHEETGLGATYARDRAVRRWARARGVRWIEHPQHGVVRPLASRNGWARLWNQRMSTPPVTAPGELRTPPAVLSGAVAAGELMSAERLRVAPTTVTETQPGGSRAAREILRTFLYQRGEFYQAEMSSPVEGWKGCSRISPHLAYGSISLRRVAHDTRERRDELRQAGREASKWRGSIASFDKRLRWHCHFMQKLEDEPPIEFRNFNRGFDGLRQEDPGRWSEAEAGFFEAWRKGQTGYPMVDACMRCLATTGWINFRMRAMLVSFAAYHLWLHWKPVATELARRFLDFEPGIHFSQCQMQSGVTGINTVRIYSPIKQVQDQDPQGVFIRKWVPELREVPDQHLPAPHLMPSLTQHMAGCEIGHHYPEPIVDHKTAYHQARERIFAVKSRPETRRHSDRVYEKHGSRRRPRPRR
ncbi:MAG: deoxyribodipyrimidine photo-lyase/cryptochrome family protein [Acidobacteriota bacterium]